MAKIQPTVGRVVWYFPAYERNKPHAALICDVNEDGTINIAAFDNGGNQRPISNVRLLQDGSDEVAEDVAVCTWMPFQLGQAAKTEQLQQQVGKLVPPSEIPQARPGYTASPPLAAELRRPDGISAPGDPTTGKRLPDVEPKST